jgi:hypothetical protein
VTHGGKISVSRTGKILRHAQVEDLCAEVMYV